MGYPLLIPVDSKQAVGVQSVQIPSRCEPTLVWVQSLLRALQTHLHRTRLAGQLRHVDGRATVWSDFTARTLALCAQASTGSTATVTVAESCKYRAQLHNSRSVSR